MQLTLGLRQKLQYEEQGQRHYAEELQLVAVLAA